MASAIRLLLDLFPRLRITFGGPFVNRVIEAAQRFVVQTAGVPLLTGILRNKRV